MTTIVVLTATATAAAGQVFHVGFEDLAENAVVRELGFSPWLKAGIRLEDPIRDTRVFKDQDGFGAITATGNHAWKVAASDGAAINFEFNRPVLEFGFWYSDLEAANFNIELIRDGVILNIIELDDRNPNKSDYFAVATGGLTRIPGATIPTDDTFDTVRIVWDGGSNDGVGFDDFTVRAVPAPTSTVVLLGVGGLALARRRRAV